LKAGMTIAATYPAAVIGMALLRLMGGFAVGREHRANRGLHREIRGRGAVFTIPAFVLSGAWKSSIPGRPTGNRACSWWWRRSRNPVRDAAAAA